jgi:hypothetical protein
VAAWAYHRGFTSQSLRHIEARAGRTADGGSGLTGLRYADPPLPVLLALILPGGVFTLTVLTCLCSGTMLFYTGRSLLRRIPAAESAVLLLPLVGVPAMWYIASQLLPAVIALTFLAFALEGFIRFAAYGETDGGFVAGIALALSYCADPGALLYAVVMCMFAPLISHFRYHDDPVATVSIGAVLIFPILAVTAGWTFLVWKFSGTFSESLYYDPSAHLLDFTGGVTHNLIQALGAAATDLAHVPLYVCAGVALAFRRPLAAVGLLLPALALTIARWLGFAYTPITAYFMFTLLGLTVIAHSVPRDDRRLRWILAAAAAAQVVLAIWWPPHSAGYASWLRAIRA